MPDRVLNYLDNLNLTDQELHLSLKEFGYSSMPDHDIPVNKFQMINTFSLMKMGEINFRAGFTENIKWYRGNIGFTVYENYRGKYLSARSCLLLKPFAQFLELSTIWLTCTKGNIASQKNIELLGVNYLGTVQIEKNSAYSEYYQINDRIKLRYRWDLA